MEKREENLVLVSRPIDFLYAIELCFLYEKEDFTILVFPNRNKLEKNAVLFLQSRFESLIPNAKFAKFCSTTSNDFLDLFLFKYYLKVFFYFRRFESLFFSGGLKGRLLYKNLRAKRVVMTDEGTFSLKKFPAIIESGDLFTVPRGKKYGFICTLLGIRKIRARNNFRMLTVFEELRNRSDKVIVHNFSNLRSYLKSNDFVQEKDRIIVLGTNPISLGIKEQKYEKILNRIFSENKGYNILLKTHKTYKKSYGFPTLESELPIEYHFLKEKKIPGQVLSFGSTSNVLLHFMFPEIKIQDINTDASF